MIRESHRVGWILRTALALGVLTTAVASATASGGLVPQITALSDTTLARSGRLLIFGSASAPSRAP